MEETIIKAKDGRGGFFAVDRRAWDAVCLLGINAAIAYLILARGSGGDNRTTKWSTNAIESKTGISRGRAKAAIEAMEKSGLVQATRGEKKSRPAYRLLPAHEVPGVGGKEQPEWVWIPNAIIDGASHEVPPVELLRQSGNALAIKLFICLYDTQNLEDDCGIHFRTFRESYKRERLGEWRQYVVWGFQKEALVTWDHMPCVPPRNKSGQRAEGALEPFWAAIGLLRNLGLLEVVAHLVDRDDPEGEIIHPLDYRYGDYVDMAMTAEWAGLDMLAEFKRDQCADAYDAIVPIPAHIGDVQLVGVARLRYRARTQRTQAFFAKIQEWKDLEAHYQSIRNAISQGQNPRHATSR